MSGDTGSSSTLVATLDGKISVETTVGTYIESGIKSILYGATDITNQPSVSIKYQIVNGNYTTDYTTINSLQNAVNKLGAGTYKINYVITYNNNNLIKNRTVILK